jgi:predicted DNA-binding transcriptional regulator AlpA
MSDPAVPELPPVLGWTELTEVLNLSKTRLRQLESSGALPAPIAELRMGRVWSTQEIREWCAEQGRVMHPLRSSSWSDAESDRE